MLLQICVFWFIWRINVDRLFYKLIFFIFYLVLVVLGVCYCTGFFLVEASEGCSLAVLCRRLIVVTCLQGTGSWVLRLQQLHRAGSVVMAMSLVALWHVGSSQLRDQTCVSCIDKWILYHCTIREAPISLFLSLLLLLLLLLSRFSCV